MTTSMLSVAAQSLRQHYGDPNRSGPLYRWTTLVNVVVARARPARQSEEDAEWIENGPLRSARETSKTQPASLAEFLKSCGQAPRQAAVLHALAGWWLRDDDREQESSVAWDRPVETLRGELRDLPGVSLTLADRLLLLVGGMPAFPIDRPTIRIAGRHGWVDSNSDYDEWQTFFTRSANDCNASLAELHFWFGETGRDFCGIRPRCDQCPLRSLLPPSGALPLSEDESD